jgi:hypothetical protein
VRLSGAQFKEHHIIQELRIPAGVIPCCCGIPSQLTQVLLTLLANAREAIMDSRARNSGQPEQGEVVLALAVTRGRLTVEQAWDLSRIDETWQNEQWGVDDEAAALESLKHQALLEAARFYGLCG